MKLALGHKKNFGRSARLRSAKTTAYRRMVEASGGEVLDLAKVDKLYKQYGAELTDLMIAAYAGVKTSIVDGREVIDEIFDLSAKGENLLRHSEDFSNVYWEKVGVVIASNNSIAPDGTMTADSFSVQEANDNISAQATGLIVNEVYTLSVHLINNSETNLSRFDIKGFSGLTGVKNITSEITSEWTRFHVELTATSTTGYIQIVNVNGVALTNISIWGAQLEKGSLTPYTKTTDKPKYKSVVHTGANRMELINDGEWEACVERLGENLIVNTNNAPWGFSNVYSDTIELNVAEDIKGNLLADRIFQRVNTSSRWERSLPSHSAGTRIIVYYYYDREDARSGQPLNVSNLVNLTIISETVTDGFGRKKYEALLEYTTTDVATLRLYYGGMGIAGDQCLISDPQIELGNYGTNHIPTSGTTVVRTAPSPVIPDALNATGVIYGRVDMVRANATQFILYVEGTAGTSQSVFFLNGSGNFTGYIFGSNGGQFTITNPFTWAVNTRKTFKFGISYNASNIYISLQETGGSVLVYTDTHTINTDTLRDVVIGGDSGLTTQSSCYFTYLAKSTDIPTTAQEFQEIFERMVA